MRIIVVPRGRGWAVQREGSDDDVSVHLHEHEAIWAGIERARTERAELILFDRHGRQRAPERPGERILPDREHPDAKAG